MSRRGSQPAWPNSSKARRLSIGVICRLLRRQHGQVEPPPALPVLDELVATILSQHTSDVNSHAAFEALLQRFPDWHSVRRARVDSIVKAIRRGGLARQKAPRIKAILQAIYQRRGELTLDHLCQLPDQEALDYLQSFSGVGAKTAACVLLFACGKPVLPVDTHVHRVSRRLGLIGERTSAEKAHAELSRQVPKSRVLEFHILLIRHGRRVCAARNPKCHECVLRQGCPEGERRLKRAGRATVAKRRPGATQ